MIQNQGITPFENDSVHDFAMAPAANSIRTSRNFADGYVRRNGQMRAHLKLWRGSLLVLLPILASGAASDQKLARIDRLERRVLAPCCYTQSVAIHQSEIALKIRLEIARLVGQGNTDEEILGTYVARYGDKVLIDPATAPKEWSYLVPWIVAVLSMGVAAVLLWRWRLARLPLASAWNVPEVALPDVPDFDDE